MAKTIAAKCGWRLSQYASAAIILFAGFFLGSDVYGQEQQGISSTSPLWVKVCSKSSADAATRNAANGGAQGQICLQAHHERLDRQTGMVLVSVAIRKLDNFAEPLLMIMVPLGMAVKPGLVLKFDDEPQPLRVEYSTCHFAGCTAETIATDELIAKMKSGRKLTVTAVNQSGRPLLFPVPLDGFTKAYQGPPIDMDNYTAERRALIKRLREPLYSMDRSNIVTGQAR